MYTSQQIKSQNSSTSHQIHYEDGQMKEKLDALDQIPKVKKEGKGSITSKTSKKSLESKTLKSKKRKQSAMQESVPITKKKISKDKSNISKKLTKKQLSSKILDLDSTGTELDLNPFWNKYTQEMSKQLWCPTEIGCVDLELKLLNGYSKNLMLNSWFSVQIQENKTCHESYPKTYLPLPQSLLQKVTDLEQLNIEENENKKTISKKIVIYPTKSQRETLKKWIGLQRWVYNQCLIRHLENQKNNKKTTLSDLRTNIINNRNFEIENTWVKEYEYDLRDEAVRDFIKNINSNIAKGGKFQLKYKSLKEQKLNGFSLSVLKKKWNKEKNFYSEIFKLKNLRSHQKLPQELPSDSRLVKSSTKEYFISIPENIEVSDNQADKKSMIFLDPGVKNFVVGYDPSGKCITWGKKDAARIARLLHHKRKLYSRISTETKNKRKKSLRKALLKLGEKISNLVTDLHKKLSKFLCLNYGKIFLPRLNFHNFKKLNKKSKQLMASYRHCEFLDKLKFKASQYNSKVFEVNEAYTSKTCSNCGFIKYDLKNADTYNCDSCHYIMGRDANASKNIMLRLFAKLESDSSGIEA